MTSRAMLKSFTNSRFISLLMIISPRLRCPESGFRIVTPVSATEHRSRYGASKENATIAKPVVAFNQLPAFLDRVFRAVALR
jgi:hypothetical protein